MTTYPTAPARAGESLVEREALDRIRCFRCLTAAQLDELLHDPAVGTAAGREKATRRLLRRLGASGFVAASRRLVGGPGGGSGRVVYQLTDSGHRVVAALDDSSRRSRSWAGASAFVEHRLLTADVALAFLRAARARAGHHLVTWESDREAAEFLGGSDLVPDGRLVYASPEWELSAFVEADLGTERPIRFADKIRRYLEAWRSGEWRSRLAAWPAVLTIGPSRERATALRRATEDVLEDDGEAAASGAEFLFADIDEVGDGGEGVVGALGRIWEIAGRAGRHVLIPGASPRSAPSSAGGDGAARS